MGLAVFYEMECVFFRIYGVFLFFCLNYWTETSRNLRKLHVIGRHLGI